MSIVEVKVPQFSESVSEGTLMEWNKQVGEAVSQDETLIEIETDKVSTTIKSEFDGVVKEILAKEDDTLPIGAVVATLE